MFAFAFAVLKIQLSFLNYDLISMFIGTNEIISYVLSDTGKNCLSKLQLHDLKWISVPNPRVIVLVSMGLLVVVEKCIKFVEQENEIPEMQ